MTIHMSHYTSSAFVQRIVSTTLGTSVQCEQMRL